jgi:CheY-like chemotaxis protein
LSRHHLQAILHLQRCRLKISYHQVLINLLTNAIKFTRLEKTRRVSIVLSASAEAPTSVTGGIQFNEEKLVGEDHHLIDDWKQDSNVIFVQFSVVDSGCGLSEEEQSSLFTRFSQASPRTHIHYGGSGLGLFISRRLTELQGGAVGLASEFKKGSTFSFYIKTRCIKPAMARRGSVSILPEDVKHRPETPLSDRSRPFPPFRMLSHKTDDERHSTPPSPLLLRQPPFVHQRPSLEILNNPSEPPNLSRLLDVRELTETKSILDTMHVLVVEDNLVNQRVLAKQLRKLGCIVNVANHGRDALGFLEQTVYWNRDTPISYPTSRRSSSHIPCTEPPSSSGSSDLDMPLELSVILMDWEMPIMNGLEAVTHIRQMEREGILIGRVPVIGVTANVRPQQIQTARAAGMDDVVGKPFRVAELLARMKEIIESTMSGHDSPGLVGTGGTNGTDGTDESA